MSAFTYVTFSPITSTTIEATSALEAARAAFSPRVNVIVPVATTDGVVRSFEAWIEDDFGLDYRGSLLPG
jgi:hypothetical protein